MRNRLSLLLAAVVVLLGASRAADTKPAGTLAFHTRARTEVTPGSGDWQAVEKTVEWAPKKTAIIICDMWDRHWCEGATKRVAEIAPRMNEVIKEARRRGVLIIHAPSSTMKFYAAHAERLKAIQAPKATPPADVSQWKSLNTAKEGPLPIDDSDGGCNDEPQCKQGSPWQRQIATLEIQPEDYISDEGAEVYNILAKHGIDNVILLGVHTNMCVLGRPFSIRQMVSLGKNVLLMRDMTDTMYNSRRKPYVSHFAGTDLVVEHIEKYWCASVTSADLLGGEPFRFKEDRRKNICVVIGENEYHTWETLPEFAEKDLARRGFNISYVMSSPAVGDTVFTNYAAIKEAEVLVLSARRRTPPKEMIALIREHLSAGKALVGIRTASHAFGAKPKDEQHEGWETFDIDVLGANYLNHYGKGPDTIIRPLPEAVTHPVLTGIPAEGFKSTASLYKYKRTAGTVTPLLTGQMEGRPEVEMLAWAYTGDNRRVFYTSLGAPEDFKNPIFRRLLLNGILWALNERVPPAAKDYSAKWEPLPVPGTWEDNTKGALTYDGFAWYRCVVKLPATWKGKAAELFVERVDNAHSAYVNGVKVGGAGALPPIYQNGDSAASKYPLPAEILRAGENNLIAIRVYDDDGRGGFKGAPPALLLGNEAIKLEGEWEFRTGDNQAWATPEKDLAQAKPHFASVADASAVAGRVFAHATQEAPFTPAESLKMFKVPDDLEIEQVLAEPQIAQPLFLNFDERGRMWVVEYRQYPFPAGLKMLSRDNVWRAVYDKVPPAPPHHFRGADKITIHEDTKGNGVFDKHTTFVEGLNIATSVTRGRGGVWVMNPPYLLFYADKNNDDVPDGDPVVHLAGFGLEDTHSVANSLRWGPDGWLYGCQGSTVTASITRPGLDKEPIARTMGQQIWRYHPETRRFEVFSEGGGNAFGLELDAKARIFSGHNGGNTRGFHYMQGAYLQKGFEKHGQLSNPYAFGYFPQMAHPDVERFTHNFIIYEGAALPVSYRGNLFGVEPLQGRVVQSEIQRVGATFKTRDLGYVTTSGDAWFKPVDIKAGPDGAIYICDWYDRQVNHYRNHEGQIDRGNGRIYRLKAKGAKPGAPFNLATKTGLELVALLKHENKWFRQEAQRLLADRKDQSLAPALLKQIQEGKGQAALEALWAHYVTAGLSDDVAMIALGHEDQYVRAWAARLLGDEQRVSPSIAARLATMAATEPDIETRAQLACTAKRLPAVDALPLVRNLLRRDEDAVDSRQPLLLWWAIEAKAETNRAEVLALLEDKSLWPHPLVKTYLLERLMRRYAAAGTRQDLLTCAKLLQLSPDAGSSMLLLAGFENAFKGRSVAGLPDELTVALAKASDNPTVLGLRRGDDQAVADALRVITDPAGDKKLRLQYLQILGEVHQAKGVDALLGLLGDASQTNLHKAALTSLQSFAEPRIGAEVVKQFGRLTPDTRAAAFTLLASRPAWAEQLLNAVAEGRIAKDSVPQDARRKIKAYSSPAITALAAKCWGAERVPTTDEMRQRITHLTGALRDGSGSPYEGQKLFNTACATCHRLFSTGGQIGPDLTAFKRDDLDTMLLSIINPSAEIREGFENYTVATKDGRTLSGFLADKDQRVVVLRGIDGENVTIPQEQIQEMKSAGISLMPEGLLDGMDDQQIRHLFAYLRSTQPLVR